MEINCPKCGAPTDAQAAFCKNCGAALVQPAPPPPPPQYAPPTQYAQPQYAQPQYAQPQQPVYTTDKNKVTAGILGILLGGIGVHKFYLGRIGAGIVYILFCWTGIPSIIGLIEGIMYLTATDEKFARDYVKH